MKITRRSYQLNLLWRHPSFSAPSSPQARSFSHPQRVSRLSPFWVSVTDEAAFCDFKGRTPRWRTQAGGVEKSTQKRGQGFGGVSYMMRSCCGAGGPGGATPTGAMERREQCHMVNGASLNARFMRPISQWPRAHHLMSSGHLW